VCPSYVEADDVASHMAMWVVGAGARNLEGAVVMLCLRACVHACMCVCTCVCVCVCEGMGVERVRAVEVRGWERG
jgi:hypothetical protein